MLIVDSQVIVRVFVKDETLGIASVHDVNIQDLG